MKYFLTCLVSFSLTHGLFRIIFLNFQIFVDFSDAFYFFIFLVRENTLYDCSYLRVAVACPMAHNMANVGQCSVCP